MQLSLHIVIEGQMQCAEGLVVAVVVVMCGTIFDLNTIEEIFFRMRNEHKRRVLLIRIDRG